jgi:cbb3-type cytochrome oxidase subunit 3
VTIASAFLWLYKNPEGANPGVRNIQAFTVTEPWDEHTLNWNNQPSISSTPTTVTFVEGAMKWYSWDITKDVAAWYRGTALNNGTMLRDETEDSKIDYASVFLSRSATHPENPYLEIKYAESNGGSVATEGPIAGEMVKEPWVFGVLLMIILLAGSGLIIMKKRKREIDDPARRLALDDESNLPRCHV